MPAFPKSAQRVLQLTSNIDASAKEIVQVIECDPVLTVKILKVINSAFYSLPEKINTVQRAVVHIGLNTVKNLVLSVAAMGMLKSLNKSSFDIDHFLLHALTTATISRRLAERLHLSQLQCSDCFVAGLLHDFGKVIFAEFLTEPFKHALQKSRDLNIPLHQAELEFIGINHAQAGEVLAVKWGLSDLLVNSIARHHDYPDNALADCIYAANQISKFARFGDSGNPEVDPFPDCIIGRFGMPLIPLIETLGDLAQIKIESRTFINP
jgi:putative nucleotidyltransferase with HDIG domain